MRPHLHLVTASSIFVYEQLVREEALFRSTRDNWCLLVDGSTPAIVMGAFAKPNQLIDEQRWCATPLPIVRRYTGGGTVVVDEGTFFTCWILNAPDIKIPCYPETILNWAHDQLAVAMRPLHLIQREQDSCLMSLGSPKKVIGHAQSIAKDRFVHHCSLLWDYQKARMDLLTMPPRQPAYREKRDHESFVMSLSQTSITRIQFQTQLIEQLSRTFDLSIHDYASLESYLQSDYRRSCTLEIPFGSMYKK